MTKSALMQYVGKRVFVYLNKEAIGVCGTLGYADEFSSKHDFRKPNYFYIGDRSFRVSHVSRFKIIIERKSKESED